LALKLKLTENRVDLSSNFSLWLSTNDLTNNLAIAVDKHIRD